MKIGRRHQRAVLIGMGMLLFLLNVLSFTPLQAKAADKKSATSMSLDEDYNLVIKRSNLKTAPSKRDETWTILVYMCGSDLESDWALATNDLMEMKSVPGNKVQFVVQTGGAYSWNGEDYEGGRRIVISGKKETVVDEFPAKNMGDPQTLTEFIEWGVKNYPAGNIGLILWNHGSGSIGGVCFDEVTPNRDSLTLREIDEALYKASGSMKYKLTFIGFDACLMATVEAAALMVPYAEYMYASQEVESGYGWEYTKFGGFLNRKPGSTGLELGQKVADSFYSDTPQDVRDTATLSVVDLSKMDAFIKAFDDFSCELYLATADDQQAFTEAVRGIRSVEYFGYRGAEGNHNMIDLKGLLEVGSVYTEYALPALEALEEAVVYKANGASHASSGGLSVYYPYQVMDDVELPTFSKVCFSPFYLVYVNHVIYKGSNLNTQETFDPIGVLELWQELWKGSIDEAQSDEASSMYWEDYGEPEVTGKSPFIAFKKKPYFDKRAEAFSCQLTQESLYHTASVCGYVALRADDGACLILGMTPEVEADFKKGIFRDVFFGYWFVLPNGEFLATYVTFDSAEYAILSSPVLWNDEPAYLHLTYSYETTEVNINGVVLPLEDTLASGGIRSLEEGDVIVPIYEVAGDEDEDYLLGNEYIFEGDPQVYYDYLPDGNYLFGFYISDLYGDYYITEEMQLYTVEDGEVYFD